VVPVEPDLHVVRIPVTVRNLAVRETFAILFPLHRKSFSGLSEFFPWYAEHSMKNGKQFLFR
jgi:hypothetical protein